MVKLKGKGTNDGREKQSFKNKGRVYEMLPNSAGKCFMVAIQVYILSSSRSSICGYLWFPYSAILTGMRWNLEAVFICAALKAKNIKHLSNIIARLCFFFDNCSFCLLVHLLIGFSFFLLDLAFAVLESNTHTRVSKV